MADLKLTPEEIGELGQVAFVEYLATHHFWVREVAADFWRERMEDRSKALWGSIALAVLRKRQEQALEELARALRDPDSAASKLRDELRDLRCPHCGKRLEDEPEERDRRG